MHFTNAVAAAALVAGVVAAPHKSNRGFTVKQWKNSKYTPNPLGEHAKTLRKFGAHKRLSQINSFLSVADAGTGGDGSVVATPEQYDSEYLCPVEINGQTFQLDFDTGSSDLWVLGSQVKTTGGHHTVYKPGTGEELSGESWKISYGDGSGASGVVYADTVQVGPVVVTSQAVEVATSASSSFQTSNDDGLLGLAFSKINTVTPTQQNTFFDNAIAQGVISKPVLGVNLKYQEAGTYDFGFIKSNGSITYTDVDSSKGFWTFTPTGAAAGTKALTGDFTGIADTGTSLMYISAAATKSYYSQVTGAKLDSTQGGWTVPCSTELPDFTLKIEGSQIVVPGKFINYAPIDKTGKTCFGGIQDDADIGFAIYGDVFLKAAYVVFDNTDGKPRLGFSQAV